MSYPQDGHNLWDTPKPTRKPRQRLTASVRSVRWRRPRSRFSRRTATGLSAVLCFTAMPVEAAIPKQIESYKLYAHSRLNNFNEMKCLNTLWTRESNWRPQAVNGSHYGIPQLRNNKIRGKDAFTQIDWGLRYIDHRYGSTCKALKEWNKRKRLTGRGWY